MKPYQVSFYERAAENPGIFGNVFIIGGSEHEAVACIERGARSVVVANPKFAEPWYEKTLRDFAHDGVRLCGTFAEDIDFEPESIDIVLSTCAIEHIANIPAVLDTVHHVLKPGGKSLFHGGPMWSGPTGHHIWFVGTDGIRFFFDGTGDANPVHDWEHLLYSPKDLEDRLISRGIAPDDADGIVRYVYRSAHLNRVSPTFIEEAAVTAKLDCLSFKRQYTTTPNEEVRDALTGRFSIADLSTFAVEFIHVKRRIKGRVVVPEPKTETPKPEHTESPGPGGGTAKSSSTPSLSPQEAAELRELNMKLLSQIGLLYGSTSWRVTAPLRRIARLFKGRV